jgi:hypothetical protein
VPDAPPLEGPAARAIRRIGFALLLLASILPYHGCIAHPGQFEDPPTTNDSYSRDALAYRPLAAVEYDFRREWLGDSDVQQEDLLLLPGDWTSNDYGYAAFFGVVPWLLVLGLCGRPGSRTRRVTAIAVFAITGCLPFVLVWVLKHKTGFDWTHSILLGAAAAFVLAGRPSGRRRPGDVEATLGTHAMLGLGIVFLRPGLDVAEWIFEDGHTVSAVTLAMLHNYRPGFHVTVVALCLVAAPLYFSEEVLQRLYDRLRPWRSRSSTPTRTSTSTASTPTAAPSSTAPAPPGSSPS